MTVLVETGLQFGCVFESPQAVVGVTSVSGNIDTAEELMPDRFGPVGPLTTQVEKLSKDETSPENSVSLEAVLGTAALTSALGCLSAYAVTKDKRFLRLGAVLLAAGGAIVLSGCNTVPLSLQGPGETAEDKEVSGVEGELVRPPNTQDNMPEREEPLETSIPTSTVVEKQPSPTPSETPTLEAAPAKTPTPKKKIGASVLLGEEAMVGGVPAKKILTAKEIKEAVQSGKVNFSMVENPDNLDFWVNANDAAESIITERKIKMAITPFNKRVVEGNDKDSLVFWLNPLISVDFDAVGAVNAQNQETGEYFLLVKDSEGNFHVVKIENQNSLTKKIDVVGERWANLTPPQKETVDLLADKAIDRRFTSASIQVDENGHIFLEADGGKFVIGFDENKIPKLISLEGFSWEFLEGKGNTFVKKDGEIIYYWDWQEKRIRSIEPTPTPEATPTKTPEAIPEWAPLVSNTTQGYNEETGRVSYETKDGVVLVEARETDDGSYKFLNYAPMVDVQGESLFQRYPELFVKEGGGKKFPVDPNTITGWRVTNYDNKPTRLELYFLNTSYPVSVKWPFVQEGYSTSGTNKIRKTSSTGMCIPKTGEDDVSSTLWPLDGNGVRRVFAEGEDKGFSGTWMVNGQETMLLKSGGLKLVGRSRYFGTANEEFADARLDSFCGSDGRVRY